MSARPALHSIVETDLDIYRDRPRASWLAKHCLACTFGTLDCWERRGGAKMPAYADTLRSKDRRVKRDNHGWEERSRQWASPVGVDTTRLAR